MMTIIYRHRRVGKMKYFRFKKSRNFSIKEILMPRTCTCTLIELIVKENGSVG